MNRVNPSKSTKGIGQLSLVEHALCPLDSRSSLVNNLSFDAEYFFYSGSEGKQRARARIFCPLGLLASDEIYLWGLLALTLLQPNPQSELFATPHWCLRQLGLINPSSNRGGRQYQQFFHAIRRLSAVTYMNDSFYDPVRAEHRKVSFRFFSYSLPVGVHSSRAWRIVWDPLFIEMVNANAGSFRFDLALYREMDNASRRLFLFVGKVLSRRDELRAIRLEDLGVNLIGFSPNLSISALKMKVTKCLDKLVESGVLSETRIFKTKPGNYFVRMARGAYFEQRQTKSLVFSPQDSPIIESLRSIGFEDMAAARLIKRYPAHLLSQWADVTLAVIERYGLNHFKKSPMAYLVDSLKNAHAGTRTPPDWWHELKRAESRDHELTDEARKIFSRVRNEVFGDSKPNSVSSGLTSVADVLASN